MEPATAARTPSALLDPADHLALQQQLFFEARLLDEERYRDWLALLTEDIHYRMPIATRRFRKDRSVPLPIGDGLTFDESLARLRLRIDRLESGLVWAEDPRNHVRRIVSNVEIWRGDVPGVAEVYSVVMIHRSRLDGEERRIVAGRKDLWRQVGGAWMLARRDIALDHTIVPDSNLNTFF